MKHQIKNLLRQLYAGTLFYTGAHRLLDRMMPRRLTVLCGHCVHAPDINGDLPPDMRASAGKLRHMLGWFAKHYQMCTLSEGLDALKGEGSRSLLALTMDDGYRDNAERLPEILRETGARATVFLESRALEERRLNWSHKYFWLLDRIGTERTGAALIDQTTNKDLRSRLAAALAQPSRVDYHLKRVMKYECAPAERDPAIDALFAAEGGDERGLCERLYMDWEGAQSLLEQGVELGGHTVSHPVLATLDAAGQSREVQEGREVVERGSGTSLRAFAYPFGRRWDYDENSVKAVREAGFECAVTTHAGTINAQSDPHRLARLTFEESTKLSMLVAEACGGFDFLRRFGIDLSE